MTETGAGAVDVRALLRTLRASPYKGPLANISIRVALGAPPADVYGTLVDSGRHSRLTGKETTIGANVGDPCELGDGLAEGYVTELTDGRHMVLAWRLRDDRWPDRHYATTTFLLRAEGGGTTLVLFQQDVPEELRDEVTAMWQHDYVEPLTAAFPAPA